MSELNINNLPAETLTEVFRYLNGRNSRDATMVCQLWNNLIKAAFRWSLKLDYCCFGDFSFKQKHFALTTNRKFGKIEIWLDHLDKDHQIIEIFKRHGYNVVELNLCGCRIDNPTGFAELLKCTPNLKHADVNVAISRGSSDVPLMDQLLPELKKLKSLTIREFDYRIIKCFRKAKLTSMKIRGSMRSEHRSLLVDFLSTQDKLTSLNIDVWSPSILVEMGKLNVPIPFRLTQLSISGITCQKPSQDHDNLMRFIESQAGTLTEIEMGHGISSTVFECVFANMTKLATLSVNIEDLPRGYDFYGRLKENGSVHTLRLLNFRMFDDQFVGKFLQKLPNVRCLVLSHAEILVMAQRLSKLESLHIESIHGTSLDNVKFPNLKTLHIQHLRSEINWNAFTKAHPMLTKLTIVKMDNESYLTSDDIDQITTNVDLQHITIGAGFVADNRFFEIVGSKCTNLKVLDLHKLCISQNLGHYLKVDVIRLRDSIERPKVFRSSFL